MGKKNLKNVVANAEVNNKADLSITMTLADTWYTIVDPEFKNYLALKQFTFDVATGGLTYIGTDTKKIAFWGESIFKLNSTDTVSYALFMDTGSGCTIVPNMTSVIDVSFANKTNSVGINGLGYISTGDKICIKVSCTGTGKILTIISIHLLISSLFG